MGYILLGHWKVNRKFRFLPEFHRVSAPQKLCLL
jgi:hypothetical protein